MNERDRMELVDLVRRRCYREGDFVLASGKRSSFYLDCKTLLLDGEGARTVARLILGEIDARGLKPSAIGGMELGAIPMVCVTSALSRNPLRMFIVRKQPKDHGTGKVIEGELDKGDRVIIVEDVVTSGASTLRAIQATEAAGAAVVGIFALVDRQEDHLPDFDRYADRFCPLTTLAQIQQSRGS